MAAGGAMRLPLASSRANCSRALRCELLIERRGGGGVPR